MARSVSPWTSLPDDVYVGRVSYDLFKESSVGGIFTLGDPRSNEEAETLGVDFELKDSSFREQKTGIFRGWAMRTDTEKGDGDGWDKVPFLGDLPFVGRLFKSKGKDRLKRAVLFFVKANIIDPSGKRKLITNLVLMQIFKLKVI